MVPSEELRMHQSRAALNNLSTEQKLALTLQPLRNQKFPIVGLQLWPEMLTCSNAEKVHLCSFPFLYFVCDKVSCSPDTSEKLGLQMHPTGNRTQRALFI